MDAAGDYETESQARANASPGVSYVILKAKSGGRYPYALMRADRWASQPDSGFSVVAKIKG